MTRSASFPVFLWLLLFSTSCPSGAADGESPGQQLDLVQLVEEWSEVSAQGDQEIPDRDTGPGPSAWLPSPRTVEEKLWWWEVPEVVDRLRPLAHKARWTPDDLAQAQAGASFLALHLEQPRFEFASLGGSANQEEIERVVDWLNRQVEDPVRLGSMIMTFDDGPLVGLDHDSKGILPSSSRLRLSDELELSLAEVEDLKEPWVLQCTENGKLLWSKKISDSPQCSIERVRFSGRPPYLNELGWRVPMVAKWAYGEESMDLFLRPDGEFLFYFLSW